MSIKDLIQTRWQIMPKKIIIYPYGVIYLVSIFITLLYLAWMMFLAHILKGTDFTVLLPLTLFYLVPLIALWLFAGTRIVFNEQERIMHKLLFGFVRTKTLSFKDIATITPVRNFRGTYQYRVIPKLAGNRTSSIIISSAVIDENSPHALVFKAQVLSLINVYLHKKQV